MKRIFLFTAWVLAAVVVFLTLGPVSDRPQLGHPQFERFAAFCVLGLCWAAAYANQPARVLAGLTLAAIVLEAAQALIPGRDPGLPDALAKVVGAAAGVVMIVAANRLRSRSA
jgi:hypothetical protein